MSKPSSVSEADFQTRVLEASCPVLVDFWAPWCAPCRALAPVLEEVAAELEGRLLVVKVDVQDEANAELATRYSIRNIPALLLFKGGEVVDSNIGSLSKSQLLHFLTPHLG